MGIVPSSRRGWTITGIVAVLVAALVATLLYVVIGRSGDNSEPSAGRTRSIGANVSVADTPANQAFRATPAPSVKTTFKQVTQLAPAVDITPSGKLARPTEFHFKVAQPAPRDGSVFVATASKAAGPWELLPATVSADGLTVSTTATHLSFKIAISFDIEGALREVNETFVSGFTSELTANAKQPVCLDETQFLQGGYSTRSDWATGSPALKKCFGMEGGQRILKVVNNLRYPLLAKPTGAGLTLKQGGPRGFRLTQIARLGIGNRTILMPREEAVFAVNIKPGQQVKLETEFDGVTNGLAQLEMGVTMLVSVLTRFGAGSGRIVNGKIADPEFAQIMEDVDKLLGFEKCAEAALDNNLGSMLKECFSPAKLAELYGWKGALAGVVAVAASFANFLRSSFNAIGDEFTLGRKRNQYQITIQRTAANPYLGTWRTHGGTLEVQSGNEATITFSKGECVDDPPGSPPCLEILELKQVVNPKGYLSAAIGNVEYRNLNGNLMPDEFTPHLDLPFNLAFRMVFYDGRDDILVLKSPPHRDIYWCRDGDNDAWKTGHCGA
jgi:hypothetical protein